MAFLTLVCLMAAQAEPAVTFNQAAESVATALAEISKATGRKLSADPIASREIVLIDVRQAPLQPFLDRLAQVTSCKWVKAQEGSILKPDLAQRAREETEGLQLRTKQISAQVQEFLTALNKPDDPKATPNPGEIPTPKDSGTKALGQLVGQIAPSDLARLGSSDRAVWATNGPTETQIPISADPSLIANWVSAHNSEVAKTAGKVDAFPFEQYLPAELTQMIKRQQQPVTTEPAKALLAVSHLPFVGNLQLHLTLYDQSGKGLLTATTMLNTGALMRLAQMVQGQSPKAKPASGATPIPYTDDSKALLPLIGGGPGGFGAVGIKIPQPLEQKLLRPDRYDPLGFIATDKLRAIADHRKLQLIADLPDAAFGSLLSGDASPKTVEEAEAALDKGDVLSAKTDDAFMLVKSAQPAADRDNRIDRDALKLLLDQVVAKTQPSLDDICAYALSNPPTMENAVSMAYARLFIPSLAGSSASAGLTDWNMYRFYGSLDSSQRQILRSGSRLPFGACIGGQQNYLRKVLFGSNCVLEPTSAAKSDDFFSRVIHVFAGLAGGDASLEPTEAMPHGLPADGYITSTSSDEQVAMLGGGGQGRACLGPMEVAMLRMVKDMPVAQEVANQLPKSGLLGQRQNLVFVFHVSPNAVAEATLSDLSFPTSATEVSLNALPSDFQQQVDKQLADLKQSPLGMLMALPMFKPQVHP